MKILIFIILIFGLTVVLTALFTRRSNRKDSEHTRKIHESVFKDWEKETKKYGSPTSR